MRPYYEADGITIYHGDCREVMPFLAPVDLLLTDPPYGIGFAAEPTKWQRRAGHLRETWDDCGPAGWALGLARSLAPHQIIWGGNYFALPPSRCWLSWHKPDAPPSMGNVEYAWTNFDQNSRQISVSISATNQERLGHPTQKPEAVMDWALTQAPEGITAVVDPWMGSGTTVAACKRVGLVCIGIEREERYCEMAANRLRQRVLPFQHAELSVAHG